ncbi:MAG: FAD:protein FMN transferase [Planctomycetes bacterium]|nr:FAD:protein FMN transferase [Planctomycetota bacterium]
MLAGLLLLCLTVAPPDASNQHANPANSAGGLARYEYSQVHMGTRFRVVLYGPDRVTANEAAQAAFDRIAKLDSVLSDYNPQSELSRLSVSNSLERPVKVSDELWPVLHHAQQLALQSDGAFDITAGPLTSLWRSSRRSGHLPSKDELLTARQATGYSHLKLNACQRTAQLLRPNMRLDLGGIAKGYAADEGLRILAKRGIVHALVAASGDIAVGAPPPGERGWRIAIAPLRNEDGAILSPARTLEVSHAGVSTSGEAEQHVDIGGIRYSHIVDPRTGLGLTTSNSVTIVSPHGMTSDALATAVSVLGPKKGLSLLVATPGVQGLIVSAKGDKAESVTTQGFTKLESR